MYEVTFLPGTGDNPDSTKSCDAIVAELYAESLGRNVLIVVDAGYSAVGDDVVNHIKEFYDTDVVDLMISTHPDSDHLNGLNTAIQQLQVNELMMHLPRLHFTDADDISNIEAIDELEAYAISQGTVVTEPFTGLARFGGQVRILGPTISHYEDYMQRHLDEVHAGTSATRANSATPTILDALSRSRIVQRALSFLPFETLGNNNSTGVRNETSVVALIEADDHRFMLTGDSGPAGLEIASLEYETMYGDFASAPLSSFQVPHHGSRHNLNQSTLDRIVGTHSDPHNQGMHAIISSAKNSTKHPSPKVTNALMRRGVPRDHIAATNGIKLSSTINRQRRPGFNDIGEYPILEEE